MSESDLLKTFSTPGAVVVLVFWLNSRMNRLEARMDAIAEHTGAPRVPKRGRSYLPILFLVAGLSLLGSGCAMMNQKTTGADGQVTQSRIYAIWPATSALDKANVKQTKTTQGIGIEGARAEGGGTNLVSALSELRLILQTVAGSAP